MATLARSDSRQLAGLTVAVLVACFLPEPLPCQEPDDHWVRDVWRVDGRLRIDVLVDAGRLAGGAVELAEITFPGGDAGRPHRHGVTELLYVMQGELDHEVNGVTRRLSPGMVGMVRAGDRVAHRVASPDPVRALVIWVPGGEAERLTGRQGERVPIESVAEALDSLRALRAAWRVAYQAGQVASLSDLYAPDAVRMPDNAPAQIGRDSVLGAYARSFAARTSSPVIRLEAAQVELRGDLAVERGTYDEILVPGSGGPPVREAGKYVSVVRRGRDGRWRYVWSIFNRARPAGPRE